MKMYRLVSEYGNEVAFAEDEATKSRLEKIGFREEKEGGNGKLRRGGRGTGRNGAEITD